MLRDATRNWGGTQPKLGLTPINKRNFKIWRSILHAAAEKCQWLWSDFERDDVERNHTALKGK